MGGFSSGCQGPPPEVEKSHLKRRGVLHVRFGQTYFSFILCSLPEVMSFETFWEDHFSSKYKVSTFFGPSTQPVIRDKPKIYDKQGVCRVAPGETFLTKAMGMVGVDLGPEGGCFAVALLFVCLFACLLVCLLACLLACLFLFGGAGGMNRSVSSGKTSLPRTLDFGRSQKRRSPKAAHVPLAPLLCNRLRCMPNRGELPARLLRLQRSCVKTGDPTCLSKVTLPPTNMNLT